MPKNVPVEDRIAPRPTKPRTLDLTAARIFIENKLLQQELVTLVKAHSTATVEWEPRRQVAIHSVLLTLLSSLRELHALWRIAAPLTSEQIATYQLYVKKIAQTWRVLKWKGTWKGALGDSTFWSCNASI